jgi:hypothetical protein
MHANYKAEHGGTYYAGCTELRIRCVPSDRRHEIRAVLLGGAADAVYKWLAECESERETWRLMDHHLILRFDLDDRVATIETDEGRPRVVGSLRWPE